MTDAAARDQDVISLDDITHEFASERILAFASEGRLVQGKWHGRQKGPPGDGGGREIACLLGSIHARIDDPSKCPASLMPRWMSYLTVRLFDGVPFDRVAHYGQAYGQSMRRWGELDAERWERIRVAFIAALCGGAWSFAESLQPAEGYAWWPEAKALLERVRAWVADPASLTKQERYKLRDDAWALRTKLWRIRNDKITEARKLRAQATAAAADDDADATSTSTPAAEAEAEAVAAEAAEAVAEAVAAEAAAEARRTSYARSFDILLEAISAELDRAA